MVMISMFHHFHATVFGMTHLYLLPNGLVAIYVELGQVSKCHKNFRLGIMITVPAINLMSPVCNYVITIGMVKYMFIKNPQSISKI